MMAPSTLPDDLNTDPISRCSTSVLVRVLAHLQALADEVERERHGVLYRTQAANARADIEKTLNEIRLDRMREDEGWLLNLVVAIGAELGRRAERERATADHWIVPAGGAL